MFAGDKGGVLKHVLTMSFRYPIALIDQFRGFETEFKMANCIGKTDA
jgi:hypothetical protein